MSKIKIGSTYFLLRDPTLSRSHIAFGYGGNIWITGRDGSGLRRLTSEGAEGKPAFSPDGEHIAFIGEYGGTRGVFVVAAAGGQPRRLTHHPDDLGSVLTKAGDALSWTPDGKRILFSSRRAAFAGGLSRVVQLFTVPLEGGAATPVPLIRAAQGSLSPDATQIAYVPHVQYQPEWKRYRGGQTTPIWIADLRDSSVKTTIPRKNSNDFNPMWVGHTIYFLSDRNGPVTLFAYDVKSHEVRQVVKNDGFDIKSASALFETIAYEQFGSLHVLEVNSGNNRKLDIRPVADFPEVRPQFKSLAEIVGSDSDIPKVAPKLSPTGARAAFAVRGEILTVPVARGNIRNLTSTPGVVERDPAWSPDGSSIAYLSDESGEYALHIRSQSGLGTVRKIDLGHPPSFYYSPTWSPDGHKIAYTDKRLHYWYVDIRDGVPVRVDTGLSVDPTFDPQDPACRLPMAWSPDGKWLAYTKMAESRLHSMFVHSVEAGKSYQLIDGMSDVLHVAFDKAGEYLYFTASTDVGLAGDWLAMSQYGRPVRRAVYALMLDKSIPTPLASPSDEEGVATEKRKDREKVEIELQDVARRIVRLPVPARNYSGLFAGVPGVIFLVEAPIEQPFAGRPQQVHRFDVTTRKTEQILEGITYFDLSCKGHKMLYAKSQDKMRQWFIASAQGMPAQGSAEENPAPINLESIEVYVDPRVEWEHLFEQVWRAQRDFLYDPGLHGVNLEEIKQKYRPFLENIVSRSDLYYLFGEMLANLTVGHMWATPLEDFHRPRRKTGLLGADYCVDGARYRFVHIYEADPWNPEARSPLSEPGHCVEVGEYLLAINGREVSPSKDIFGYFENTAGNQVVLTVGPEADGSRARNVNVVPIDDEYALRYYAWTERNRRVVDKLSGGRVAYVHLPDCRIAGYTAFNRYFFAQIGKESIIIDGRYNNGGLLPDYVIDCLRRPLICYWHMREGRDAAAPSLSIFGPKAMLINEMAGSMGDILPWIFRRAGIGPSVGKRTWGGLVGNYAFATDMLDDSLLSNPNLAFYAPESEWEIENCGVSPDVEVDEDPKAAREGQDVQLERAVEVVMDLLKRNPPPARPQRPPYPRYSQ